MSDDEVNDYGRNLTPAQSAGFIEAIQRRRLCLVCAKFLASGERKVHAGECARRRDTELQRMRRQRRRIAFSRGVS